MLLFIQTVLVVFHLCSLVLSNQLILSLCLGCLFVRISPAISLFFILKSPLLLMFHHLALEFVAVVDLSLLVELLELIKKGVWLLLASLLLLKLGLGSAVFHVLSRQVYFLDISVINVSRFDLLEPSCFYIAVLINIEGVKVFLGREIDASLCRVDWLVVRQQFFEWVLHYNCSGTLEYVIILSSMFICGLSNTLAQRIDWFIQSILLIPIRYGIQTMCRACRLWLITPANFLKSVIDTLRKSRLSLKWTLVDSIVIELLHV